MSNLETSPASEDAGAQPVSTHDSDRAGLRPGHLGAGAIIFFVVAAVAPMAAIVGASPIVFSVQGPTTPMVYLLAALLFAVFSVGYVAMSRHITNAGGFVAYMAQGLGARVATAGAALAILFYGTLQAALWSQFSVFAQSLVADKLGVEVPPWVIMFVALFAVTGLVMLGIDLSLKVLGVLVALEIAVFVVLDVAIIVGGGGPSGNSFAAFNPSDLVGPGLGVAFLFAFSCFTGFEATVVFSEEAKNPRRTIPRAVYGSIAFIGGFYALTAWALGNAAGNDSVQAAATADPAGFVFAIAEREVGGWLSTSMEVLVVTSFIAMLIGFQNMFARYVYALGRAHVLPARLGTASSKGTPTAAALGVGVLLTVILAAFQLAGADPITVTYSWLLSLGTVALIAILILTSVSVVAFFARTKLERNLWVTVLGPILSIVGFGYVAYLAITNYDALLGGQGGIAKWLLILIPVFAAAGYIWALIRPGVDYQAALV
ncbi:APC family permease [Mycobacterium sp. AT1]|uniref:APC family permease n=1 Tax=Mycobacterium sp. AT1 TaxID=1961706 RepID=UPI0009ADE10D|nr:APC family permease [Mycobacterium sp. AT1]